MREIRSPLDGIISPFASRRFTPSLLFRANEPGYAYDLNDVSTLFKDVSGTQPVAAAGDAVALRLDKSRGLALGAELVTNGDFSSATGWTTQAGWSISGGLLVGNVAAAAFTNAFSTVAPAVGKAYQVTYTITALTSGAVRAAFFGGTAVLGAVRSAVGTYTELFVALTGNASMGIQAQGAGFVGTIDNISVRELAGNHATQSDLTKRPLYSLLPANGLRNLANGSASGADAAVWPLSTTRNGVTATRVANGFDTDGLDYVELRFQGTSTGTFHEIAFNYFPSPASAGQSYTCSAILRVVGGSTANTSGLTVRVQELDAVDGFIDNSTSDRVTAAVDTLSSSTNVIATGVKARALVELAFTSGTVIDVTFRIKALQFELGPTRTAYQFNYSATNISQPPFSQVGALLYDGVDDFMVTPVVDFSGTDEVFLCHGVRRLADTPTNGVVLELGNVSVSSVGTVTLHAPGSNIGSYGFASRGTVASSASSSAGSFPAPDSAVLSAQGKISTDVNILRRNGAQAWSVSFDQGTGNFINAAIYFGARGGTSLFFKGYEFSSICRGRTPTAAQIVGAEGWVRARTAGAY